MIEREDVYFSADVETDGPIPGPFSILSFALVYAGRFDGKRFERPKHFEQSFYRELRPISDQFEPEALAVNRLDRDRLLREGDDPEKAMTEATRWVRQLAGPGRPVLVAYPLSFDWTWLYWYFVRFSSEGSPFNHSGCFDLKTAIAVKAKIPISAAGQSHLAPPLQSHLTHSHHALQDAIEQAEIFANVFEWEPGVAPLARAPATVLAPQGGQSFEVSEEQEAALLASVEEAERGAVVSGASLLRELRSRS